MELVTGGTPKELPGILRIKERKNGVAANGEPIGSLIYVAETGHDAGTTSAKFQVNVAMPADKFATLLRVASTGRLPTKFFVDAGAARSGTEEAGLGYRNRAGGRIKVWDNHAQRSLPIGNFVMILPIDVPAMAVDGVAVDAGSPSAAATNAQVAELADDMLEFQSDTRNTLFGLVGIIAIVAIATLVIGIAAFFR